MASKFRRTLSLEDLVNGSDDEMEELLCPGDSGPKGEKPPARSKGALKNGIRVGPIIAPGVDSPDNDDFFLHGPQAPVLNLDHPDLTQDIDSNQNRNANAGSSASSSLPRSKSVRFQEPEDVVKKVKGQVDEVTGRMKDNVQRLLDREASLGSLQDLSDQLQYSGDIYRQSSEHLRRKMWWRQQRTRFVLGAVFLIGIFLLLVPIITKLLQ